MVASTPLICAGRYLKAILDRSLASTCCMLSHHVGSKLGKSPFTGGQKHHTVHDFMRAVHDSGRQASDLNQHGY